MCSYTLFSTFRGNFRADCIEQFTTFEREFFMCLLELTVFCSYPGQKYQTICRCHSLGGSTFSSDILDSECWSGLGLEPSTSGALQRELNRQRYLRAYWHFLMLSPTSQTLTHQIQLTLGVQSPATNHTILFWRNQRTECLWLMSKKPTFLNSFD